MTTFNRLASGWWDTTTALHTMNSLRVPLIRNAMVRHQAALLHNAVDSATPLKGMTILDVGCGGGILSEVFCSVLFCSIQGGGASARLIAPPVLRPLRRVQCTTLGPGESVE